MFTQVKNSPNPSAWFTLCILLGAFTCLLCPAGSFAQDKIQKTDKTVIEAKVVEIGATDIKYKKFSNPDGPTYIIPRKDVSVIVYENGEKEVYNQPVEQGSKQTASAGNSGNANPSNLKARNFILNENINEAISAYSKLISNDNTNATLLAEDAYALALGGIYDAALLRLDMSWNTGSASTEVSYFTAQIFALMGYDDIAGEFWKPSDKTKAPAWIAPKAAFLVGKYSCKHPLASIKSREELITRFKQANELAAHNSYFQSIALFHDITTIYPDEYLPYVGYSITLEKTGAFAKAAQTIEKALSLIGNSSEDITKKQFLQQRLSSIQRYLTTMPPTPFQVSTEKKQAETSRPQMMAYAGGMVAPSLTSINGRIGYFISGSTNAALDIGVMKSAENSFTNIGFSVYGRHKSMVEGVGMVMTNGNNTTSLALKISLGVSKMNTAHTSSIDVFLDVTKGLQKDGITTAILSIGTSFYFGKR